MLQSLRTRLAALAAQRLRMPLPAGKGKGPKDRGPAKTGALSAEVVTGVAIKKGEQDPPVQPDDYYPAWLFELLRSPDATAAELERRYASVSSSGGSSGGGGGDGGGSSSSQEGGLTLPEMKRLFRLRNKQRIRESNALRAKK